MLNSINYIILIIKFYFYDVVCDSGQGHSQFSIVLLQYLIKIFFDVCLMILYLSFGDSILFRKKEFC